MGVDRSKRTVLVTGANSGIGLATLAGMRRLTLDEQKLLAKAVGSLYRITAGEYRMELATLPATRQSRATEALMYIEGRKA
jgi:hypothetical protein